MTNPFSNLNHSDDQTHLSEGVKNRIRANLETYVSLHPIRIPSPYQRFLHTFAHASVPLVTLVVIIIAGLGGTTSAASVALPGEPLYSLKVGVLEPVRGFFAVSPESKAEWNVSVVDARLRETEQLAAKSELTTEESAKSKDRFDQSLQAAQSTLKTLSKENPSTAVKIKASFAVSLGEHKKVFTSLVGTTTSTSTLPIRLFATHFETEIASSTDKEDNGENEKGAGDALLTATSTMSGTSSTTVSTSTSRHQEDD